MYIYAKLINNRITDPCANSVLPQSCPMEPWKPCIPIVNFHPNTRENTTVFQLAANNLIPAIYDKQEHPLEKLDNVMEISSDGEAERTEDIWSSIEEDDLLDNRQGERVFCNVSGRVWSLVQTTSSYEFDEM